MNIKIKGLDEKLKIFKTLNEGLLPAIGKEVQGFVFDVAANAVSLAPADEGHLRNSIKPSYTITGNYVYGSVVVSADYAAYLEFGTRKFAAQYVVTLPNDWQEFAAQYRGPGGGTFEEFVMRLTKWILRKGVGATYSVKTHRRVRIGRQSAKTTAEADAYAIALYIVRNGIQPHPFLYPAFQSNKPNFINQLKALTGAKYIQLD